MTSQNHNAMEYRIVWMLKSALCGQNHCSLQVIFQVKINQNFEIMGMANNNVH